MAQLILLGAVLAIAGIVVTITSESRVRGLVVLAVGALVALSALAAVVVRDLRRRDLPAPAFASLTENPDPSLRGTVAFIAEVNDPSATDPMTARRRACARVISASGARSTDAYCWSISKEVVATAVWQDDGRLLVTSFDAPAGENRLVPRWAKLIDVATGDTEDVPKANVGDGARPPAGPATDPDGNRLIKEGADGTVHVQIQGPSGNRTLLKIEDANPDWGIFSGPRWSPDFQWILMWDGTRLLLTTIDEPTTRVLVAEASGVAFNYDVLTFDITDEDVLDR